ncbi:hypothetical protein [Frigoriflavimonas asaccharolytica]|uniref:Uncharacterized protein n=1 Tax=Frigoriflavimonas asaccharolytica TaxID=2735899 RepID=A0A8J8K3Z5_9FLAO|nr:hypothetical protein [Frigoriflavimonas asaccharolytica]NRS91170.1 hypothetical protein [Frigoriflavimonas asaccharolytica]
MQNSTDILQKVFSETKEILQKLSDCQSIDDFLALDKERLKLQDYTNFLKIYKEFEEEIDNSQSFSDTINEEISDNQSQIDEWDEFNNNDFFEKVEEEESFDEIEQIENSDDFDKELPVENILTSQNDDNSNSDFEAEDKILIVDENITEEEMNSQETVEISMEDIISSPEIQPIISSEEVEILEIKHQEEKKLRLSNIKGVKKMETLFEDDFFEKFSTIENVSNTEIPIESNVSLEQMEVQKEKPIFKLDLNDRIAFTKKLFSGSQNDLNEAVTKLNVFTNLEDAKEYLSELYYDKNWEKEDEFAQRLWSLVESKFQ